MPINIYCVSLIAVPPEIRDQDKVTNKSVTINQPISLFCEVSGNPFPIITWYKDDVQVCIAKFYVNQNKNQLDFFK